MESLINIVNKLQDVCHTAAISLPLDLPQIVVAGAQSHGKSSVIESIVQREFLPRGTGTVTRRPLVIRLFKIDELEQNGTSNKSGEWVKFNHSEKKFTDFDEVRQEIENETDRVCGQDKGISPEPITLAVYSKNVVNLTLVDLPGFVMVPKKDQPEDIEIQIHDLVMSYISNPNSIILAVTAANNDIQYSEAIKLARKVDPEGKRTLAVLTKLDDMGAGTDALEVLEGRVIPVRLGIIGVVNRSQEDILNRKSIQRSIEDESTFLRKRYPTIADKHGQPYLTKRLSQLLMRHIRDCLPKIDDKIKTLTAQYQAELESYGLPVTDQAKTILSVITRFSQSYCGTIKDCQRRIDTAELYGDARINYIFQVILDQALLGINPLDKLDSKAILNVALNEARYRKKIPVADVFELLVANQIERLKGPCLSCVDLVHKELGWLAKHCDDEVHMKLSRFPKLREKIEEVLKKLLDERLSTTKEAVTKIVCWASSLIDEDDPRLAKYLCNTPEAVLGDTASIGLDADDPGPRHERALRECDAIARKIQAYFNMIRDEMKVLVPRAVMHDMINHIKSNLHQALINEVYENHHNHFDQLLEESDDIAQRRKRSSDMLNALTKASEIINNIHHQ